MQCGLLVTPAKELAIFSGATWTLPDSAELAQARVRRSAGAGWPLPFFICDRPKADECACPV